jgi:hypothetical protein
MKRCHLASPLALFGELDEVLVGTGHIGTLLRRRRHHLQQQQLQRASHAKPRELRIVERSVRRHHGENSAGAPDV